MIYYGCPKCNEPLSSPESMAGKTETCPKCGNVTTVPVQQKAAVATANPAPPPAPLPAGPVTPVPAAVVAPSQPASAQAETELLECRPAMFRASPITFILCVLLVPFLLGALLLLIWWLQCKATCLTVTNKRTTLRRGILSKHTTEVRHTDVRNIQVRQGVFQRMFGIGAIGVSTAGTAGVELQVSGIPHPKAIADMIRQYQAQ